MRDVARQREAANVAPGEPIQMRQFYIDREFDNFPLHHGVVRVMPSGKVEIQHDWLSGTGEATLDSSYRLLKVWRTGANAATQFTTVDEFTISVLPADSLHGKLMIEWGPFKWTAPIVVHASATSTNSGK